MMVMVVLRIVVTRLGTGRRLVVRHLMSRRGLMHRSGFDRRGMAFGRCLDRLFRRRWCPPLGAALAVPHIAAHIVNASVSILSVLFIVVFLSSSRKPILALTQS